MIPGDRLFCVFVDGRHVGDTFTDWPLHITIMPWFRVGMPSDELGRMLSQRLGSLEPFMATIGSATRMGHHGRKAANLLETPSPLETIERQVRRLLKEQDAWLVDETTKKHRTFMPHVTVQKAGRTGQGDTFMVDSLYIVEQKGEYKEIVSRINV